MLQYSILTCFYHAIQCVYMLFPFFRPSLVNTHFFFVVVVVVQDKRITFIVIIIIIHTKFCLNLVRFSQTNNHHEFIDQNDCSILPLKLIDIILNSLSYTVIVGMINMLFQK